MEKLKCKIDILKQEGVPTFPSIVTHLTMSTMSVTKAMYRGLGYVYNHMYLTSDRPFIKGSLFMEYTVIDGKLRPYKIYKCIGGEDGKVQIGENHYFNPSPALRRIEASSNPSLSVFSIPYAFMEKYAEKGGSIESVGLVMTVHRNTIGESYKEPKVRSNNTVVLAKLTDTYTTNEVVELLAKHLMSNGVLLTLEQAKTQARSWLENQ